MEQEYWKQVVGYEGLYEVSNLGNIKSLSKKVSNGNGFFVKKEIILKPYLDKNGYGTVNLYKDKKKTLLKVHRIVGLAFIPNPQNKPTINHKNSIRNDNRVENLEWNTHSENNQHAFDSGFQKPMKKDKCWMYNINPDLHPASKDVINLKTGKIYKSLKTACIDMNIKYSTAISKVALSGKGKNDTDLMYVSDVSELPKTIIVKIGNRDFKFHQDLPPIY